MVLDWGMSEQLPNLALGDERDQVFLGEQLGRGKDYSERTADQVDQAIQSIVDRVFQQAYETLSSHRAALDSVAEELMRNEEIPGARVAELIEAASGEASRREAAQG
jgi:cell division protease FtsH